MILVSEWMNIALRDAPFDIWGGGVEFLLQTFFFTSGGKQNFFWRSTSDNFFLLCYVMLSFMLCRRHCLSYAFPIMYVFSGQHIFHQFRQQTFFSAHIFNKLFFSDFCGDKLFFSILI